MPSNDQNEMFPVYLFIGFLEAGKTKFVQSALEDERFSSGERTLVIICEDGEEEYDLSRVPGDSTYIHVIEDAFDLNPETLQRLKEQYDAERAVIEYNGMWQLKDLFDAMPEDWGVYQVVMVADASTFLNYNANMRSLVVDKLNMCEMVYFNRVTKEMDVKEFHQIVRGVSRGIDIYYEYTDGNTVFDDLEDPLPFDTEADHITLEDTDFALWFRDMQEDPKKYAGKTMTFKALAYRNNTFPKDVFAVGRHIMTCCVEDIQYCWIAAHSNTNIRPHKDHWITVTGVLKLQTQGIRKKAAPMLEVTEFHDDTAPEQPVATFY